MTKLLQTLDEILYANLDVTTGAISWNIVNLACYADEQQQLFEEIGQNNAGLHGTKCLDDYLLRNDTFLAACVYESARLRPVAGRSTISHSPTMGAYS